MICAQRIKDNFFMVFRINKNRLLLGLVLISTLFAPYVYAVTPTDPAWSKFESQGVQSVRLPEAWDITHNASNVTVAVIDTGVDDSNPDIAPNIVPGWNFIDNNSDARPNSSASSTRIGLNHGTVVAGIIGAVGNNDIGSAGVAWRIKIMPLKILDEKGDGDSDLAVKAIDYAINHKVDIINLSFVGPTPSLNFIQAVRRAYRAGIVVVAAAGNGSEGARGLDLDFIPQYPVCFDDPLREENWVIGVAALGGDGAIAPFSNYGARCVDVSAPGYRISSTVLFDATKGADGIFGGAWSGTSIAAPFVSGLAALIKSVQPSWTPDQIRKAILDNTDPIPGNDSLVAGRGSIDAAKTLRYAAYGGDGGVPTGVFLTAAQSGRNRIIKVFDPKFIEANSFVVGKLSANTRATAITTDVSGSGVANIVVAIPDKKGTLIKIFQRNGALLKTLRPFNSKIRDNANLSAIDLDRDGADELLVTPEHSQTTYIMSGDGTIRTTITTPDQGVNIKTVAFLNHGDPIIATAALYSNHVVIYEWNKDGAFIRSFSVPIGGDTQVGVIDRTGNGTEELFVVGTKKTAAKFALVSLEGVFSDPIPVSLPGRFVSALAGRTAGQDYEALFVATQKGKDLLVSSINEAGRLSSVSTKRVKTVSWWNDVYFGR